MSLVELKKAIQEISAEERAELAQFLAELEADAWDRQIEADAKAGKLRKLEDKARESIKAGKWREL